MISYTNSRTLHIRLRLLAVNLEKSIILSQNNPSADCVEDNFPAKGMCGICKIGSPPVGVHFTSKMCEALYNVLGADIYDEIMNLLLQIEVIRMSHLQQKCSNRKTSNELATENTASLLHVLFHTKLIHAMNVVRTTKIDISRIANIDWEKFIKEARSNIEKYEIGGKDNILQH